MPVAFASDVVGAVPTASPSSSTPDFPEEDPTKEALDKWIDAWDAYAATNGYAPMLQGRDPPSVIQFTERDLSHIPALPPDAGASAIAAREALRAQVIHDNAIKRAQRLDTLCDHRHRFTLLLIVHLRPRAGLRLQRLLASHIVSGTVGGNDALYDGIAMYQELRALRTVRMTKPQRDAVRRALADLEASPLTDGCSVQAFSSRVNVFTRDINPFLDRPYAGSSLSEFIVEQMPPGLLQAGLALMRELTRAGTFANADEVIRECKTLVAAHEAPAARATSAPAPLAVVTAKEMKRLLAADDAAALQSAVGGRPLAPEALAVLAGKKSSSAAKKPGGGSATGPRTTSDRTGRLPDGGRCADGTCQFRHDGPCFRHPKTTTVPSRVFENNEQLARIEADRQTNARSFGVPYTPLKPSPPRAPSSASQPPPPRPLAAAWSSQDTADELFGWGAGAFMLDAVDMSSPACFRATRERRHRQRPLCCVRGGASRRRGHH